MERFTMTFMDTLNGAIKEVFSFVDKAHKEGWLIYAIIGIILGGLYLLFFA